jgi:LPS export ABC transporter protein LptC
LYWDSILATDGFSATSMTKHNFYILFFVLLVLQACTNESDKDKVMNERINLPIETGKNIYITYTDSGLTKAKVFAPILERFATETRNETVMKNGITAYFYSKDGKIDSYLKSKFAVRYDREKKMIARNDVILVNSKGDTLNTEELIWEEAKQTIHSDKYVRITTKDEIIMGDGFESNTEFTKYKIFSIRGTISLKQ